MEIDAILNESKFRPPSLFEGRVIRKKEIVFTKYFTKPVYAISLRPFSICADLPFVVEMFNPPTEAARSVVAASYLYSGTSDFARSFVCILDSNLIVGSVDICMASKDELYDAIFLREGDYILRLLIPLKERSNYCMTVAVLTTCMEYFFLFPEVVQLFIELCDTDKEMIALVQKCGFRFYSFCDSHYSPVIVFYADRQSLIV